MTNTKIERLKAIKEQFALAQSRLVEIQKLEESAQTSGMATLLENDLEQAELVLAAQDMMHKLQNMAEDLAKMNAQDLFPLVDKMKAAFGQDKAHGFEEHAQNVLSQAMQTVRAAKDEMGNAIMRLEGKMPANDMAADAQMDPSAQMGDAPAADASGIDAAMDDFGQDDDAFGGADANAGPAEEPLGRVKKESVEGGKALNESIILEHAGRALILSEGLDSLIDWVLTEAAAGMPEEHFRSFAKSVAQKAAKDPAKLAGWIGKKKHGMAAMAQLAEPTFTQGADLEIVGEGKTYKANDDEDNNWGKKKSDQAKKAARKEKGDDTLGEGKTYKRGEDADEDEDKKSKDVARKSARKQKGDDSLEEGKTFKRGEDADEDEDKKSKDVARKSARKQKGDDSLEEGKTFKRGEDADEDEDKKSKDVARKSARKQKGDDKLDETVLAARAVAQLIEASIKREGKGNAAKAVKEAVAYLAGQNLTEGTTDLEALVLEAFHAEFGMKPASYSVAKTRQMKEDAPMSPQDKEAAAAVAGKLAAAQSSDSNAGNQPIQSAMSKLDPAERTAAQKLVNNAKQNGQNPQKASDLAAAAQGAAGDDDTNESVVENINAAHWPTDSMGQYKGEPMSTDYGKLKPLTGAPKAGKTETTSGGESEAPKAEKSEKPASGKPWEKKSEEPAEEPKEESETVEEGFKDKLKKAALGAGAAAALATGAHAAPGYSKASRSQMDQMVAKADADGRPGYDAKARKDMDDLVTRVDPKAVQRKVTNVDPKARQVKPKHLDL